MNKSTISKTAAPVSAPARKQPLSEAAAKHSSRETLKNTRPVVNVATLKLVRNITYFNPCNISTTAPFMLQPFACGVELLLRTLPSKCIARVSLLPERRTNIAKLVRPTLQCFRTICCTFHSTPSRRICRATATHRISKTNVHSCPCQARRIYRARFSARTETAASRPHTDSIRVDRVESVAPLDAKRP